MSPARSPKWGLADCATRLIYKLTSQRLISFIFAATAIFTVCVFAGGWMVFTSEVALAAIRAIKELAIALLAVRTAQSIVTTLKGNGAGPSDPGEAKGGK